VLQGKECESPALGEVAGLGGLQNWVCSVAEGQARRGYEVELMQPPWIDPASRVYTALPVHRWNLERVRDFDIVHSHGLGGFENRKSEDCAKADRSLYYGTILGIQIALRWFQNLVGWNGLAVPRTSSEMPCVAMRRTPRLRIVRKCGPRFEGLRNSKRESHGDSGRIFAG